MRVPVYVATFFESIGFQSVSMAAEVAVRIYPGMAPADSLMNFFNLLSHQAAEARKQPKVAPQKSVENILEEQFKVLFGNEYNFVFDKE